VIKKKGRSLNQQFAKKYTSREIRRLTSSSSATAPAGASGSGLNHTS
jgi:hypothetical protein